MSSIFGKRSELSLDKLIAMATKLRDDELPVAEARAAKAREAYEDGYLVALDKGDTVAAKRLEKSLSEAEEAEARVRRDLSTAERAVERKRGEIDAEAELTRKVNVTEALDEYIAGCADIDKAVQVLAASINRTNAARAKVAIALGSAPRLGFNGALNESAIKALFASKLYGLTEGRAGAPAGVMTVHDAKEALGLQARAQKEKLAFMDIEFPEPTEAA